MRRLGLRVDPASTQIVQRDRHANWLQAVATLGASLEQMAVEIRNLQRTDVHEVEESFGKGQKGSSAMPHKKNPIVAEKITGMARLLRGYAHTALENVALWHERDISHSSVERIIFPDACHTLHHMLTRMDWLVGGLVVFPANMKTNMDKVRGMFFSQPVLLALTEAGVSPRGGLRPGCSGRPCGSGTRTSPCATRWGPRRPSPIAWRPACWTAASTWSTSCATFRPSSSGPWP